MARRQIWFGAVTVALACACGALLEEYQPEDGQGSLLELIVDPSSGTGVRGSPAVVWARARAGDRLAVRIVGGTARVLESDTAESTLCIRLGPETMGFDRAVPILVESNDGSAEVLAGLMQSGGNGAGGSGGTGGGAGDSGGGEGGGAPAPREPAAGTEADCRAICGTGTVMARKRAFVGVRTAPVGPTDAGSDADGAAAGGAAGQDSGSGGEGGGAGASGEGGAPANDAGAGGGAP